MKENVLTETERKIFDTVTDSVSITEAAKKLRVSDQALYNFFYNFRKKYYKRFRWINVVLAQKRRSQLLRQVLTDRAHAALEQIEEEDENTD